MTIFTAVASRTSRSNRVIPDVAMKPISYLLLGLVAWLFSSGQALAIDFFCLYAGEGTFMPAHPGPSDIVTYFVQLGAGQVRSPPFVVLNKTVVGPGNQIQIDDIVTTDTSPFPEYQMADLTPALFVPSLRGGSVGVLSPGLYSVSVNIRTYDSATKTLQNECGAWTWQLLVSNQAGPTATAEVIEFYNARLDRYFISQAVDEIAALDSGLIEGWSRTGQQFLAYLPGQSDWRGYYVSRFYRAATTAHVFTELAFEKGYLLFGSDSFFWQTETSDAFELPIPNIASGACPAGTISLYRLWDGRADSDHRYTTDRNIRQQMIDRGFIPEGYGADAVFLCALAH